MPELGRFTAKVGDINPAQTTDYVQGRDVQAGVQQLGNTVLNAAENSLRRIEQTDIASMQASTATARAELHDRLDQYVKRYGQDPHDREFSGRFLEESSEALEKYEHGVSTAAGRQAHGRIMEGLLGEFAIRIDQKQSEMAGVKAKTDILTMMNANANLLFRDPAQFVPAMQEQTLLISLNEDLTFEQREELTRMTRSSLAAATVRGIALDDPQTALDQMAAGIWDVFLDADSRAGLVGSLTNRIVTEATRSAALAERTKKAKGEEEIKTMLKMHDEGKLSRDYLMSQKDWLTPSDFKLGLAMVNNVEPDADQSDALLILENTLRDNPELTSDMASFLYSEGTIRGSTLRTYASAGRTAARQEGFKSQRERSATALREMLKPGPYAKFDLGRNVKYANAMREFADRTEAPDLSDDDIAKIERSVALKWTLGGQVDNAWRTTNHGVLAKQKDNLIAQARVLETQFKSGALTKEVFKSQYGPIVARLQTLNLQEQNLERGK